MVCHVYLYNALSFFNKYARPKRRLLKGNLIYFRQLIRNLEFPSFPMCMPIFAIDKRFYAPHVQISWFLRRIDGINADTPYILLLT